MAKAIKVIIRLIPASKNIEEIVKQIKEIINTQWRDEVVIMGSGEGSTGYDIAIVIGDTVENTVGVTRDGKRIQGTDLEDLIERVIQAGFNNKIQSRLAKKPQT